MPQNDRHKERKIPIEFDFYNTLESLPIDNRCTIIMISCGSTTFKINEHIQTIKAPLGSEKLPGTMLIAGVIVERVERQATNSTVYSSKQTNGHSLYFRRNGNANGL